MWTPIGSGRTFHKKCLSDTGCSRTVIAKDVVEKYGIPIMKNVKKDRLLAANKQDLHVNGVVELKGTYKGKSIYMSCLVTDDLEDEIIVSWHDSHWIGAVVKPDYGDGSLPPFTVSTPGCKTISTPINFGSSPQKQLPPRNFVPPLSDSERDEILKGWYEKYPCLSDELSDSPMKGDPMIINLVPDMPITPKVHRTGVKTPLHYREGAQELIRNLTGKHIIRQTKKSQAPVFCARGFFVPKGNGKDVRLVIDHSDVNKFIKRPTHPFTAGPDLIASIPHDATCFAKLDALWGYYQIDLAEESRYITCFITEFGTYEYCRAPMGLNSSGDEFCRRSDDAIQSLVGVLKLVDDILVYASNYDELFRRVEAVLQRCTEHNITLSKKKIEIGDVTFAGYDISAKGHSPTAERIKAIVEFPTPFKDVTAVRSFLGMCTGLGSKFITDFHIPANVLNELLRKGVAWTWDAAQESAVAMIKKMLTKELVLSRFNPGWKTQVVTDASRVGLGFALMQQDPRDQRWYLVQCGSRSVSGAESRYAVCELEGLGILFAVEKCRHFLLGMTEFEVITDHKSLKGVFEKSLPDVKNARLRRYRERLQEYNFKVDWRAGKFNEVADCLSRYPLSGRQGDWEDQACVCSAVRSPDDPSEGLHIGICGAIRSPDDPDPQLAPLIAAADNDPSYQELKEGIQKYWRPQDLPPGHPGHGYNKQWDNLSIHATGLIIYNNDRIIVPKAHRKTLLERLHSSHCGISKSQWRGRRDYWWPKFDEEIANHVKGCDKCIPFLPSQQQQPIIPRNDATGPMQAIGIDLYQIGSKDYLVVVDQFSGWPFAEKMPSTTSAAVVAVLRRIFNMFGNPERIYMDNGTNLVSNEFNDFVKDRGIPIPKPGAPYYPQANGLAESAVKQVKHLLEKYEGNWDVFQKNLLEWRDTPNDSGSTPAEMFLGRRLRTSLPTLPGKACFNIEKAIASGAQRKKRRKDDYAKRRTHDLPILAPGQTVSVQNPKGRNRWDRTGRVIHRRGRKYFVEFEDGARRYVNRIQLRLARGGSEDQDPDTGVADSLPVNNGVSGVSNGEASQENSDAALDVGIAPAPVPVQEPEIRRSTRAGRGKKSCHQSCAGCHKLSCSGPSIRPQRTRVFRPSG